MTSCIHVLVLLNSQYSYDDGGYNELPFAAGGCEINR